MELVWIEPGHFLMGSPEAEHDPDSNDQGQHRVTLTKGLWMQTTLVTQKQWEAVMGKDSNRSFNKGDDLPVDHVSYDDAQELCENLSLREKREHKTQWYRLPYEAEWEYAARAGTTTPFWQGETIRTDQANFNGNLPYRPDDPTGADRQKTTTVRYFKPNAWGLHDMGGNLAQWCENGVGPDATTDFKDRKYAVKAGLPALRGGSWISYARHCRVSSRRCYAPHSRLEGRGCGWCCLSVIRHRS
jgi:formylglycine-generating enzyme required for sulfatase activity